jgi:predicted aldo/keto reductase-like oxidoreductase
MKDKESDLSRRELLTLGGAASVGLLLGTLPAGLAEAAKRVPQVPRRVLGKTGEKIPILLMGGSMDFDKNFDPKLAEAVRFGVNYVDTADCYAGGNSEIAVGNFHTRAKLRDKLWITSKSDEHEPEGFARTLQTSLRKLRTDRVDLYFLHALKDASYLSKDLLKTVERLKKEKKLRFFGFSAHHGNVADLLHRAAKLGWVDAVMFRYNFHRYGDKALNKAMDACHKAKVGLIAMKTQGSAASFKARWVPFEQKGKWDRHQAVLKAVWADERIAAAVSAMDTLEKLRANVAAAVDKKKLGALELDELKRYAAATRALTCDGCDHLCGAAVDAPVRIGDTMRYLMYHDVYGEPREARRLFAALPAEARALARVDFIGASRACPHGLDVAWHVRRAAEVLG